MKASVMLIVLMTFFVGVVAQGQLERFGMWVYDWNNQNLFNRNHGNVGINTQNPTEALDVMGNVKVDGGVILNTNKQRPACTNANRGELWLEKGTIDTFNVCLKADLLEVSQMVNQDERTTECTGNPNGNVFYCFGGIAPSGLGYQSSILELDVQAQTVTTVSSTLPSVRFSHSCVYHNQDQNIYCFGGQNSGYLDEIIKFDTVTKTVSIQNAVLPTTNRHHSCASHPNGNIYCFGGDNNGPTIDTIVEYDVQNDVAQTLTVTMPKPLVFHSCVTDQANGLIYCFGGSNNNIVNDEIFQFDPSTQSITTIPTTFPDHGRQDLSCVYDQSTSWIFCYGGQNLGVTKQDIFGFDPSTLGMIRLESEFDIPVRESSCTSIQGTTYCVGSSYGSNPNIYAHQPSVLHWESLRG